MFNAPSIRFIARAVLDVGLVVGGLVASSVGFAQTPTAGQGKVKVEWLGHEFYRLTSPKGVVVITSPWLANPDGPVPLDNLARTDFILVPNSHNDDMGNPIEIAALSGATVIAPGPLGHWLIEKGLKKEQFRRAGIGDQFVLKGITFKIGPSAHDNTLADGRRRRSRRVVLHHIREWFHRLLQRPFHADRRSPALRLDLPAQSGDSGTRRGSARVRPSCAPDDHEQSQAAHHNPEPYASRRADPAEGKRELDRLGIGGLMFVPELKKHTNISGSQHSTGSLSVARVDACGVRSVKAGLTNNYSASA